MAMRLLIPFTGEKLEEPFVYAHHYRAWADAMEVCFKINHLDEFLLSDESNTFAEEVPPLRWYLRATLPVRRRLPDGTFVFSKEEVIGTKDDWMQEADEQYVIEDPALYTAQLDSLRRLRVDVLKRRRDWEARKLAAMSLLHSCLSPSVTGALRGAMATQNMHATWNAIHERYGCTSFEPGFTQLNSEWWGLARRPGESIACLLQRIDATAACYSIYQQLSDSRSGKNSLLRTKPELFTALRSSLTGDLDYTTFWSGVLCRCHGKSWEDLKASVLEEERLRIGDEHHLQWARARQEAEMQNAEGGGAGGVASVPVSADSTAVAAAPRLKTQQAKCAYCRRYGHAALECRKRLAAQVKLNDGSDNSWL